MVKRIQIPLSLYELMVSYIQDHYNPADHKRYWKIMTGVEEKRNAEIRHNLYSSYKTQSDPDLREMLRISYLDKAGIPSHGRWEEETEEKYREQDFFDPHPLTDNSQIKDIL